MNNYQNSSPRKCVPQSNKAPRASETLPPGKKKKDPRTPSGNPRNTPPNRALKIFYESDSPSFEEPRFEWGVKKKIHRDASFLKKTPLEENAKGKKEARKHRNPDLFPKNAKDKTSLLNNLESQLSKKKSGRIARSSPSPEIRSSKDLTANAKSETTKVHDLIEKSAKKIEPESNLAPLNSLFTLRKDNEAGKKPEKVETTFRVQVPPIVPDSFLTRKTSGKVITMPDVKPVPSNLDYGKRDHINEILKGHAQKTHSSPVRSSHQIKEYAFQGATELLQKCNITNTPNPNKEEKEPVVKKEVKQVEEKPKTIPKTPKEPVEPKEPAPAEEVPEEKKKIPNALMNLPQSSELERRLNVSWHQPGFFRSGKDQKPESNTEGDKKPKTAEEEEEKKNERRTTYTDRLLLLRALGREREEKKEAANQANNQTESDKAETGSKKLDSTVSGLSRESKTISITPVMSSNKELVSLKDSRNSEIDQVFRTKSTRSTELRDLVTQAVKEHKIFCIFDNHWYIVRPVREELLSRGWLEVIPDRKLIPRRRPPPMGPTYDRDKSFIDRNCNTIEAILAAKEVFADELQETVSKSSSFRTLPEKPKPPPLPTVIKKSSDESLSEALSLFRIIPPTSERKKNNCEIREFVTKYQALLDKDKEKENDKDKKSKDKEKDKNGKVIKKEKLKTSDQDQNKTQKNKPEDKSIHHESDRTKSLQAILNTINENKRTILHAASEIKTFEGKNLADTLGIIFDASAKSVPAIESSEAKNPEKTSTKSQKDDANQKTFFSDSEAKMISKIIQSTNARIHFMWLSIKPSIHLKCFNYSPEIVNKFQKTTFCTKIGLWSHLNSIQWYAHEVHFPAKSPRMYNTGEADDLQAFFQDFQITACIGMLKWLADTFFDRGMKAVQTKKGKVPLKAFEFAIKQCEKYIRFKDNEDLGILEEPKVLQEEWNTFLQWFYIITNDHGKIQESSSAQLMVVYTKAIETLKSMKRHWPEIDIDGRLNIWIMKPYCASCGRGIFMTNNVYYIGQHSKYIVQKYIERPLLIYNTKFDIRQWFMITKLTPLEIWMYKECYLRFCTQPFALRNLHESVHLSNNSVQRKYISFRDPGLPDQNMWDSNTFQLYLKTIGHPNTWEEIIYPGMRDAIVSTMLAAQDTFDGPRRSWFEVYGADFMLSANPKEGPWLIEINENPAMDPSTKVTARLCPQMLRDVIKVVVDKRANKNASTGGWELVYRQNYSPSFGTVDLDVRGKKIARLPHITKVGLNLPQHPSTSPNNSRRRDSEDGESNKLYEIIKGYDDTRRNSRGDFFQGGRSQEKEKTLRNTRIPEKDQGTKNPDSTPSYLKMKKTEWHAYPQSLAHLENKTFKQKTEKTEENHEKAGTTQTTPEVTNKKDQLSLDNPLKDDKKTLSTIPSKGGFKRMRNSSSTREAAKTTNAETEKTDGKGNFSSPDARLPPRETKRTSGAQDQSNIKDEKYKFTKFYKV